MNANAGPLILLPVDGSESSARAAEYCVWFARPRRACPRPERPAEFEDWQTHGIGHESPQAPRGPLARKGGAGPRNPRRHPHEFPAREGEAAETIGRIAEERDCVGVVMGTRGLGKVSGVLMGSVAMKAFHVVKVPLTFIR